MPDVEYVPLAWLHPLVGAEDRLLAPLTFPLSRTLLGLPR